MISPRRRERAGTNTLPILLVLGVIAALGVATYLVMTRIGSAQESAGSTPLGRHLPEPSEATADFKARLAAHNVAFQALMEEFQASGGISPGGLEGPEGLDARLDVIDRVLKENADFTELLAGTREIVKKEFEKRGADAEATEAFLDEMVAALHLDLLVEARELDQRFFEHARSINVLLKERWGDWSYDAGEHKTLFSGEDAAGLEQQYLSLHADIQKYGARQAELATAFIERMREAPPVPGTPNEE